MGALMSQDDKSCFLSERWQQSVECVEEWLSRVESTFPQQDPAAEFCRCWSSGGSSQGCRGVLQPSSLEERMTWSSSIRQWECGTEFGDVFEI